MLGSVAMQPNASAREFPVKEPEVKGKTFCDKP